MDRTFINEVFNLLGIGLALYTLAMTYGWVSKDNIIKHTVKCKYCRKRISEKVSTGAIDNHGVYLTNKFGRQNVVSTVQVGRMIEKSSRLTVLIV